MHKCYDCKFCDIDYIFDEEIGDEYEILSCDKGHDTDSDEECVNYKKYNAKEYKEEFSRCDTCENLKECVADGKLIEATTGNDKSRHFMKGIIFGCKKDLEALKKYGIELSEGTKKPNTDEIIANLKENLTEDEQKKLDKSIKSFADWGNGLWEVTRKGIGNGEKN